MCRLMMVLVFQICNVLWALMLRVMIRYFIIYRATKKYFMQVSEEAYVDIPLTVFSCTE